MVQKRSAQVVESGAVCGTIMAVHGDFSSEDPGYCHSKGCPCIQDIEIDGLIFRVFSEDGSKSAPLFQQPFAFCRNVENPAVGSF